ncbi:MAG: redoxin domain-containing protein [Hellea sp.]|nr:redoxin domain-containing protein [Hellea sp.]
MCLLAACTGESANSSANDHAGTHVFAPNVTPSLDVNYVDNFVLFDQNGDAHELYYYEDAPAIVLMVQGNGCPIVRNIWADLKNIREEYSSKGVRFYMLNANVQDDRSEIKKEAEEYGIDIPVLKDETQLIAASLGVNRTAEVFVIDPSSWEIIYRGPVNDRLGYERQKREPDENYLADTLDAMMAGQAIATPTRPTKGCLVNMGAANNAKAHAKISYSKTIAPMLEENCVTCHQEGGIGPWAMEDYDTVYGFSPMIREVVRTKRMPPWSADPEIGEFHGARQLSISQQQDLIRWIEAGAPRGEGPDPLEGRKSNPTDWPLGQPDLIVEAPAFDIPATGVIDYQFPTVLNPLNRDVWVKAITVVPGDRAVVHHALIGSSEDITPVGAGNDGDVFDNYLVGFVPGSDSYDYPENSGVLVKAGGEYRFQIHYTPSGRKTTDRTKIGLYFHDEPPAHQLRQQVAINFRINIPAGAEEHEEKAYFEFDHPAEIFLLFPHSHYRGKSSRFDLEFPDGRVETLLSVPRYDFNWQHNYALADPVMVPAGSRLIHSTVYDNSTRNFANPDPDRDVGWGLQSDDEMLYGSFFFRWTEETADNPVHDPLQFELRQFYGFGDANMDGKLQPEEMRRGLRAAWDAGKLTRADQDQDGALSFNEFYMMEKSKANP